MNNFHGETYRNDDLQWENNYIYVYGWYESRDICTGLSQ